MKTLHFFLLAGAAPAVCAAQTWDFRVYLDERDIGSHRFTLIERGDERMVQSEARFSVDFLFFNAYRYRHDATERWKNGCLSSLVSRTDDNGEPFAVDWRAQGECTLSFAYWNPRILRQPALLNAQTGELEPVRVTALGEEQVALRGARVVAQRYRLTGRKLAIDLWYADGGRWVALETMADGGRRLRYRLDAER